MKRSVWFAGIAMGCALFMFGGEAEAGRVANRQARQHVRIDQGVASGELTRGEAHALRHEQARLRTAKRAAWSDGALSPAERAGLEHRQDRASHHIYRLRNNGGSR
jgi:hypothetical protein